MSTYTPTVPENWEQQAEEIAETTLLSERQAAVAILSAEGVTRQTIADELGEGDSSLSMNTIDEHKQRVKRTMDLAANTLADQRLAMFAERAGVAQRVTVEPDDDVDA